MNDMKKILLLFIACSALLACNKMEDNSPKLITITGGINLNDTKAQPIDPTAETVYFDWEEGDTITLFSTDDEEGNTPHTFTIINSSIDKTNHTASFTGEAFEGIEKGFWGFTGVDFDDWGNTNTTYVEDSYKAAGVINSGTITGGFTVDYLFPVLNLKLTGSVTIGKIVVAFTYKEETNFCTLNCGEGVQLSSTEKVIYFPLSGNISDDWEIKIYDTNESMIMKKKGNYKLSNGNNPKNNKIIAFPVLNVTAN